MSGSSFNNFSQLAKLPSATADSDAQVGLGIRSSFTKPSLSGHFLYTGRCVQVFMRKVTYLQNPTDDVVRLMIYKSGDGVYVFGFDDLSDSSAKWDNLYLDLEDANQFCQDVYNVDNDKWIRIEDPHTNCQHDWIGRTRIMEKENGKPQWGQFEQLKNGRWTEIKKNEKLNSFHGMSGNERLWSSGLVDEFEKSLKTDKVNAEKILRALHWDEATLKNMLQ